MKKFLTGLTPFMFAFLLLACDSHVSPSVASNEASSQTVSSEADSQEISDQGSSSNTVVPTALSAGADVRGYSFSPASEYDLRDVDSISKELFTTLTFNESTMFPTEEHMPSDLSPDELMKIGMDPGLGVRELHEQGITGKHVNVAIIDQPLMSHHPEFDRRIVKLFNLVNGPKSRESMYGPVVTSLFVGKTVGTAPEANVYYASVPAWLEDGAYEAKALDWILSENASLPADRKIRVVAVARSMDGEHIKNASAWQESKQRAADAGILVLDYGDDRLTSAAYFDCFDRDNFEKLSCGFPDQKIWSDKTGSYLFVPTSYRTVAEQLDGYEGYSYWGVGAENWTVPYTAGVLAMGWQVRPEYTAEQMVDALKESAYIKDNVHYINPPAFIELLSKNNDVMR